MGQTTPKSLEGLQLEEILVFMVVFMGSPGYVKNPFLRSRISEVWLTCTIVPDLSDILCLILVVFWSCECDMLKLDVLCLMLCVTAHPYHEIPGYDH